MGLTTQGLVRCANSQRCLRPVPAISIGSHSYSPKGIDTTAPGRDALVAHPGFQATECPYPERVAPLPRPAWTGVEPLQGSFQRGTLPQGARPRGGRGDSIVWLIADSFPIGCGYDALGTTLRVVTDDSERRATMSCQHGEPQFEYVTWA